jgi:LPS-assembly protein
LLPTGPALAVALACAAMATPAAADPPLTLKPSTRQEPAASGDAARQRPIFLRADDLKLRPDIDAVAEGAVEFRRASTVIKADHLTYDSAEDQAHALGGVQITMPGAVYRGPELQLKVQRFEGFFLSPTFEFTDLGSGGSAQRIDFIDSARANAIKARYSSCPRDGSGDPDWLLRADAVRLDNETSTGIAEGAVLTFLGVPVLGLPVLSFPLSDERKSGWLPPTVVPVNSRNGFTFGMPYYWNIAPNRDATLEPIVYSRLGLALNSEFRYLEPGDKGRLKIDLLPNDKVAERTRMLRFFEHQGECASGLFYDARLLRVSDDNYWKDFAGTLPSTTQRLLPQSLNVEQPLALGWSTGAAYARVNRWQVLQTGTGSDLIVAPYERSPQIGLQLRPVLGWGLRAGLETEVNHFTRPDGLASATLPTGWRWHGLAQLSRRFGDAGIWWTPRVAVNAAAYRLDQEDAARPRASRIVPTFSLDAGMAFERSSRWFGRLQKQTLEPRLLYVNTPYVNQSALPQFDAADRDFNMTSLFTENAFTGVDRVSDAHQVTVGAVTRWVDAENGAETLRLGLAQRYRFRTQRVVLSGDPLDQRVSDLLLDGSTGLFNPWFLDASLQYSADTAQIERSILSARYAPGPFRTLSLGYRLQRGSSEQAEIGWQWPVYRSDVRPTGASGGCGGTLYAVGRVNYSIRDRRSTDALIGAEYDAGCWIGRVVFKQLAIGSNQSATQLMLQVEFVGLSRIGASPLQALKDNIPGYRLLRAPGSTSNTPNEP